MDSLQHDILRPLFSVALALTGTGILVIAPQAHAENAGTSIEKKIVNESIIQQGTYFTVKKMEFSDGTSFNKMIISGPSTPPSNSNISRTTVSLPTPQKESGINTLTVPAYTWVYGCTAVSAAMIAGYYDRNGFPNIYTGPTNDGVIPLTDSWGTWTDDAGDSYPNVPLAATHKGADGLTSRGSIDDYWLSLESTTDPYASGGWTQHSWGDAIGDYMKTSQNAYGNEDGATTFFIANTTPTLTCATLEQAGSDEETGLDYSDEDGNYGRKLFYEARGYTVTDCYTELTNNYMTGGFSFSQFKTEIDAGRPVMIHLEGHTIVGIGYDNSSNLVYIHDTWDNSTHSMIWGGSYSNMEMVAVSVVNLSSSTTDDTTSSTSQFPIGAIDLLLK